MKVLYCEKYVALRHRPACPEEARARWTALGLKLGKPDAIAEAASAMARLIEGPCWLVPVPDSTGSTEANLALAIAIHQWVTGSRVRCLVTRSNPVESSCMRRLHGLPGLTVEEHGIIRNTGPIHAWQAYFVDNVVTTGNTAEACRRALGWGIGLVYADASSWRTGREISHQQTSLVNKPGLDNSVKSGHNQREQTTNIR